MFKIDYKQAIERWSNDKEVYLLYDDNTEGLVENVKDIKEHHKHHGEFGYEVK